MRLSFNHSEASRIWSPATVVGALAILIAVGVMVFTKSDPLPAGDALRYITYSLNLSHHGVFSTRAFDVGTIPDPTLLQGGPLVVLELALVSWLDSSTLQVFTCAVGKNATVELCQGHLFGLKIVHYVELLVSFVLLWLISLRLFGSKLAAAAAVVFAMLMREVFEYSNQALTEPLYLMMYLLFLWSFLRLTDQSVSIWRAVFAGVVFGATIMIKPAALPLLIIVPALLLADAFITKCSARQNMRTSLVFVFASLLVIGPWLLRNWVVADVIGLADQHYLAASLAHRLGYNMMSWTEWAVGWVFYLPGFGDDWARALFPPETFAKLSWDNNGYYVFGRDVLYAKARSLSAPGSGVGYLLNTHVFGEPIKYIGVSLLLLWRGIFLSSSLGLIAVLALPFVFREMPSAQRRIMLLITIPAFVIAAFQAGISVSISRYNLALVPVYAIALTWLVVSAIDRIPLLVTRLRRRKDKSP